MGSLISCVVDEKALAKRDKKRAIARQIEVAKQMLEKREKRLERFRTMIYSPYEVERERGKKKVGIENGLIAKEKADLLAMELKAALFK